MQDEWDIEMADDDEELTLIPDDEQSSPGQGEGGTIQDILSGGRNRCSYLPQLTVR